MHPSPWQWADYNGHPFLRCDLLNPWPHGFFTRHFWPQVPEDLTPVLHPQAAVQRVKQVHGNRVLTPTAMAQVASESPHPEADALMSDGPNQALWVCSADCNPVLIGDCATGHTAAIHAGWRGTALKIVPHAVAKMQSQGSRLEDLRVAIGPAIDGAVYPVATSVAAEVGRTILPAQVAAAADHDSDAALVNTLQSLENSPILLDPEPGKARLDVRQVNVWQLTQLGLRPEQIAVAPHCTFQEPERFFSYRRTGEKQVQWSGIVSRGLA